ncbi:MAG: DinB family protein, partial [Flavobacteriales bacterium]
MTNAQFFKACLVNELRATREVIAALPADQLNYRPHPVNRSAYEIAEHIVAHVFDLEVLLTNDACDELLVYPFTNPSQLANEMETQWEKVIGLFDALDESTWDTQPVELKIQGQSFLTIPRSQMLWFFFFDIIHHRGQLTTYIRPMGGKNPGVYGPS